MAGTVLIVDDDAQVVRHLEYLLRAEGYQVAGASNAAEVRKTVRVFFPDVVLLDLKLPDADGLTLMKEIQKVHPAARYLIMTAYGSIRSAIEATRLGATGYMTKPVDVDELLISVRNALRERVRDEEVLLLRRASSGPPIAPLATKALPRGVDYYPSEAMRSKRLLVTVLCCCSGKVERARTTWHALFTVNPLGLMDRSLRLTALL
jgi:DNA-binding response OmpR family regulator